LPRSFERRMSPRVHVSCGFLGTQKLLELLPAIERLGFDGVTLPDHVFLPEAEGGRYPYSADGRPPFRPTTPWPDQLVLAGAIGAAAEGAEAARRADRGRRRQRRGVAPRGHARRRLVPAESAAGRRAGAAGPRAPGPGSGGSRPCGVPGLRALPGRGPRADRR